MQHNALDRHLALQERQQPNARLQTRRAQSRLALHAGRRSERNVPQLDAERRPEGERRRSGDHELAPGACLHLGHDPVADELRRRSDDQERRARRHERQKGKRRVEDSGARHSRSGAARLSLARMTNGDRSRHLAPYGVCWRSPRSCPGRGASGASRRMGRRVSRHGAVSSRAWRHLSHRSGRKPKRRRCHLRPIRRNGRAANNSGPAARRKCVATLRCS